VEGHSEIKCESIKTHDAACCCSLMRRVVNDTCLVYWASRSYLAKTTRGPYVTPVSKHRCTNFRLCNETCPTQSASSKSSPQSVYQLLVLRAVIAQLVWCWATGWTIGVPGFHTRRGLEIFLLTTASEAHPASYPMGTASCFPGGKAAGA
jgi:hypothetical protein